MWKTRKPAENINEEEWVRTIQKREIMGKTYKIEPAALKGIVVKSGHLTYKTIDLDKYLRQKEKEGYKVEEDIEGITLTKVNGGKTRVFIAADDIHYDLKKAKKVKAESDVEEVV